MTLDEWLKRFSDSVTDLTRDRSDGPLRRAHANGDDPDLCAEAVLRIMDASRDVSDGLDEYRAVWNDYEDEQH